MNVDRDLVTALGSARLGLPGLAAGQQAGDRRSRHRGRGMEFADHRPYVAGDDLRLVDWNVYARLRTVLVKLFHEDRNLHLGLCVDASGSMGLGRKGLTAATLAAALAMVGLQHRDLVTLALAGGRGGRPRLRGHQISAFGAFLRSLEEVDPDGTPDLPRALRSLTDRGRVDRLVLVSDLLLEPADREAALRSLAASGRHPAFLHVLDREELHPDLSDGLEAVDSETGDVARVGDSRVSGDIYAEVVADYLRGVRERCTSLGILYVPATTDVPLRSLVLDALRQGRLLESRQGGRR